MNRLKGFKTKCGVITPSEMKPSKNNQRGNRLLSIGLVLALSLGAGLITACGGKNTNRAYTAPPQHHEPVTASINTPSRTSYDYPLAVAAEASPSSGNSPSQGMFPHQRGQGHNTEGIETLIAELSSEAAGRIYYGIESGRISNPSPRIAVVAAVPLSDLKRESEFGRVLQEYLLTDLADRGVNVTELRLGRDIHIIPQSGEFILSRNVGELAAYQQEVDFVVVSTYSNTRNRLMVYGRLVDLHNGSVTISWRHNLPLNRELLGFFQENTTPSIISVRGIL